MCHVCKCEINVAIIFRDSQNRCKMSVKYTKNANAF